MSTHMRVMVIDPESKASGRSIEERNVIAGNSIIVDSSLMVPLSDSTHMLFS